MSDFVQSAKSVADTVTGFLGHHITDLNNIAGVLGELVGVAPIDSQDKSRIQDAINGVRQSADNVTNFLQGNTVSGGDVVVKESDIVAALANYFNSDAGKQVLANATKGNSNG